MDNHMDTGILITSVFIRLIEKTWLTARMQGNNNGLHILTVYFPFIFLNRRLKA